MSSIQTRRESWDSLSSSVGKLDISFSQDSSYGSDEVSVTSNTTAPLQSSISTSVDPREVSTLQPFLKSILKKPTFGIQDDSDCESGYDSDQVEFDYDSLSDDEDDAGHNNESESESESEIDDDDEDEDDDADSAHMSDFSVWDEDAQSEVPESRNDHTEFFDDSFIGFESSVRFHPRIQYFAPQEHEGDTDNQMTAHEMMLLALKSGESKNPSSHDAEDLSEDESETSSKEYVRKVHIRLEDFSSETIEGDRRQFIAYMIAIHGIANKYESYFHSQAEKVRLGHDVDFLHADNGSCVYLDEITNHVVGVFRHLLAADELSDLIATRKNSCQQENQRGSTSSKTSSDESSNSLLIRTEHLLLHRLIKGEISITADELSFFAGGILKALGTRDLPPLA